MGEVIAFKAEKDGTHLRPPPEGSAKIVFFTGVWHEPINDRGGKKRRASGLGKASAVTRIAPAARAIDSPVEISRSCWIPASCFYLR